MEHPGLHGYFFEELKLGQQASVSRTITETDLRNFSGVSGDTNPMHLSEEFAKQTIFGGTIVHGMLTASLISAVIGTKLPGPGCIYMSQTLKFLAPVRVGDTVYATATVRELNTEKKRALLTTQCFVRDTLVVDGEALIKVPSRPQ
ncbi:MAG: MaoC family dehydratase [Rickettsiales bacterium]|jgi:3-hydroxybutyryl-CoA dehydratase|nr:MaoC family dehydratase [Rickettsiales bacterium]